MKLAHDEPGRYTCPHGDGRAVIQFGRSGWKWSVVSGGREVARGREFNVHKAREKAMGLLRAPSNGKEG